MHDNNTEKLLKELREIKIEHYQNRNIDDMPFIRPEELTKITAKYTPAAVPVVEGEVNMDIFGTAESDIEIAIAKMGYFEGYLSASVDKTDLKYSKIATHTAKLLERALRDVKLTKRDILAQNAAPVPSKSESGLREAIIRFGESEIRCWKKLYEANKDSEHGTVAKSALEAAEVFARGLDDILSRH